MFRPVLATPPAATPISLDEVKAHVGAKDFTDDDTLLMAFMAAAVTHLDGWTGILGRCLMTQEWRQDFIGLERRLCLPLFPVSAITGVKYDDPNKVEQTIDPANYDLLTDDIGAYVRFKFAFVLPQFDSYNPPSARVTYSAGYADAASVPDAIKTAMLLLIGHWYANRENVVVDSRAAAIEVPYAAEALLAPFRRPRF